MSEEEIPQWLVKRGRKKDLSTELAKKLAAESRLGGLIFPHGHIRLCGDVTVARRAFSRTGTLPCKIPPIAAGAAAPRVDHVRR